MIREKLKDLLFLFISVRRALSALWNKNATTKVIESLTTVNVKRPLAVNPTINGLLSTAPKKKIPIIVVSQSIVPLKTMAGLGTDLMLNMLPFPVSSQSSPYAFFLFK